MPREMTEKEKKRNRQDNSVTAESERRRTERRKQELSFAGSGEGLQDNSIDGVKLQSHLTDSLQRAVGQHHVKALAVQNEHFALNTKGGDSESFRLRRTQGNGSSQDAARQDHNHSVGFKSNFTQAQRKAYIEVLHELEAIENPSPVERMCAMMARMMADDPDMTCEELVYFLDNGDPLEVHEWRVNHEQDYHAREMLLTVPSYRVEARTSTTVRAIAEELGVDYTAPVTEKEEDEAHIARRARQRELEEFPEILKRGIQHKPGRAKVDAMSR